MFNSAADLTKYHDDEVTLQSGQRTQMRQRRNANRDRLKAGLGAAGKPQPYAIVSQGSYAMRTMVQSDVADIDIDDGAYFQAADLAGGQGAPMSALEVRQMVAQALRDKSFNKQPEVRDNCARVFYAEGHHVDVPAYRRVTSGGLLGSEHFELASVDWKRADARAVTEWFNTEVKRLSPASDDDQLRRIVRLLKKFVRNRPSWKGRIASGFCITKLATECFSASGGRDDQSLRYTADRIYRRLLDSTVVHHPVVAEDITKNSPDPKTAFLRDKLAENLPQLEVLDSAGCTQPDARNAWDKFFGIDWFSKLPSAGGSGGSGQGGPYIAGGGSPKAVEKKGGHGYA